MSQDTRQSRAAESNNMDSPNRFTRPIRSQIRSRRQPPTVPSMNIITNLPGSYQVGATSHYLHPMVALGHLDSPGSSFNFGSYAPGYQPGALIPNPSQDAAQHGNEAAASPPNSSTSHKRKYIPDEGEEQKVSKKIRRDSPDIGKLDPAMVTVTIGEDGDDTEPESFVIHKELACYYSPFLRAAFKGSFIEGQTQAMTLKTTTTGAFTLFVRWLYSGTLHSRNGVPPSKHLDLYQLALLADKFLIPELQNLAIRELYQLSMTSGVTDANCVQQVYRETLPEHPLRLITIDLIGLILKEESLEKCMEKEEYPMEFLRDVVMALRRNHGSLAIDDMDVEEYMVEVPEDDGERAASRKAA